ncbi:hypothetical protein [Streptomyces shenzhenensis]|uniref:Uncharacterized protein n=1 Tax=Streptomyces shenzhenensis TaxID=943815 RepID=A0A3M0I5T3_9ACTN|nr:hypothetical protein [Streptomyces shenzhenensis]RMB84941.1 hypothetical protein CTZ28_15040 [Streptomyces shenzhenensis]
MTAVLVLFGVLGGAVVLLVVILMRRTSSRTETADGLLIEREARLQAQIDRVSFNARAVDNSLPTTSDAYHRRHRPR